MEDWWFESPSPGFKNASEISSIKFHTPSFFFADPTGENPVFYRVADIGFLEGQDLAQWVSTHMAELQPLDLHLENSSLDKRELTQLGLYHLNFAPVTLGEVQAVFMFMPVKHLAGALFAPFETAWLRSFHSTGIDSEWYSVLGSKMRCIYGTVMVCYRIAEWTAILVAVGGKEYFTNFYAANGLPGKILVATYSIVLARLLQQESNTLFTVWTFGFHTSPVCFSLLNWYQPYDSASIL